jgi:hypothetical protein
MFKMLLKNCTRKNSFFKKKQPFWLGFWEAKATSKPNHTGVKGFYGDCTCDQLQMT